MEAQAASGNLIKASVALPITAFVIWIAYLIGLGLYRLYLSPIAKFPGPKLAALSLWYEFYYEVTLKGQFSFHIQELHKKYGPIVRINPYELHIEDTQYYDELYSRTLRLDKYEYGAGRFGNSTSVFTTSGHDIHAHRRAPLSPMFSKRAIVNFQPIIREKLEILCKHIAKYKETGTVFNVLDAYAAFAGDVITEYAFGISYDHLDLPEFKGSFHDAYMAMSEFSHVAVMFPWIHTVMNALPDEYVEKMNPAIRTLLLVKRDMKSKIQKMINGETEELKEKAHPTIFHEVLQSDLPPEEKAVQRLGDEAQTILGAGLETTAWALSVATFNILNNPEILKKLRGELIAAIPGPYDQVDWQRLEKLPYLTACIQEALRLSYGVTARHPRVSHQAVIQYKEWAIPPETPVSMSTLDIHHDESIFPDSYKYSPERWLENPQALGRYLVSFGKDARSCLGINMAYAELYLVLATVFRRFELELYQTDVSDVKLAHDFFLPAPKLDSKGIRVKVIAVA